MTTEIRILDVTTFLALLFIYIYIFKYLENKGPKAYADETQEGKYFNFSLSLLRYLNFILLLPFLLYLLFIKKCWIEPLFVLAFFYIGNYAFRNLSQSHLKLVFNYHILNKWCKIGNEFKLKTLNSQKQVQSVKNTVRYCTDNPTRFMLNEGTKFLAWFPILNTKNEMNLIFVTSLLMIIIGLFMGFNLISIIYLLLNFMLWYSILSVFLRIPIKVKTITLTGGKKINYVYVIEESQDGYILTLDSQNQVTKIMSASIETIEFQ